MSYNRDLHGTEGPGEPTWPAPRLVEPTGNSDYGSFGESSEPSLFSVDNDPSLSSHTSFAPQNYDYPHSSHKSVYELSEPGEVEGAGFCPLDGVLDDLTAHQHEALPPGSWDCGQLVEDDLTSDYELANAPDLPPTARSLHFPDETPAWNEEPRGYTAEDLAASRITVQDPGGGLSSLENWLQGPYNAGDREVFTPALPQPSRTLQSPTPRRTPSISEGSLGPWKSEAIEPNNFSCSEENCTKTFGTKDKLRRHQRCHKPKELLKHRCTYPECSEAFVYPKDLKRHSKVHIRPHLRPQRIQCNINGCRALLSADRPDNIRRHRKAKHGE